MHYMLNCKRRKLFLYSTCRTFVWINLIPVIYVFFFHLGITFFTRFFSPIQSNNSTILIHRTRFKNAHRFWYRRKISLFHIKGILNYSEMGSSHYSYKDWRVFFSLFCKPNICGIFYEQFRNVCVQVGLFIRHS